MKQNKLAADDFSKDLGKAKRRYFFVCLLCSVLLVGGIPMIPLGFVFHKIWIGILGIVFVGVNFYAVPILWIGFGAINAQNTLVRQIKLQGIDDLTVLARLNNKSVKYITAAVQKLIKERYLVGYMIANGHLAKIDDDMKKAVVNITATITANCPFCGGHVSLLDGRGICGYCNCLITPENLPLPKELVEDLK